LYPTAVHEAWFKAKLKPEDTVTVKRITGSLHAQTATYPIGAIQLFNVDLEGIERKDVVGDSDRAESSLFDGQLDQLYGGLQGSTRATTKATHQADVPTVAPIAVPTATKTEVELKEELKLEKKADKQKRNTDKTADFSDASDDWFDSLPVGGISGGSVGGGCKRGRGSGGGSGSGGRGGSAGPSLALVSLSLLYASCMSLCVLGDFLLVSVLFVVHVFERSWHLSHCLCDMLRVCF
jgi:hypothetical protein